MSRGVWIAIIAAVVIGGGLITWSALKPAAAAQQTPSTTAPVTTTTITTQDTTGTTPADNQVTPPVSVSLTPTEQIFAQYGQSKELLVFAVAKLLAGDNALGFTQGGEQTLFPLLDAGVTSGQLTAQQAENTKALARQIYAAQAAYRQQVLGAAANGTQAAATPAQSNTPASNTTGSGSVNNSGNSNVCVGCTISPSAEGVFVQVPGQTKIAPQKDGGGFLEGLLYGAVGTGVLGVWAIMAANELSNDTPAGSTSTSNQIGGSPPVETWANNYECSDTAFDGAPAVVGYNVTSANGNVSIALESHQQALVKLCMVFMDSEYPNQGWSANRFSVGSGNGVSYSFARQGWKFNIAGFLKNGTPVWGIVPCYKKNTATDVAPGLQIVCNADGAAAYALTN